MKTPNTSRIYTKQLDGRVVAIGTTNWWKKSGTTGRIPYSRKTVLHDVPSVKKWASRNQVNATQAIKEMAP